MKIGYLRTSTTEQNPQRQIDSLQAVCDELHIETLSATKSNRPVFKHVLRKLKQGDTLIVHDLDRAFRSTIDTLTHIDKLSNKGVEFKVLTFNIDTSTPFGRFILTIIAAQAQLEREILSQRTKEGMEAARKQGKRIGRPKKTS